eukprot:m.107552 g.107552  ORF g.107552 m.107552 type:complete len:919 (+) comp19050_c3_seq2:718-3474(+)
MADANRRRQAEPGSQEGADAPLPKEKLRITDEADKFAYASLVCAICASCFPNNTDPERKWRQTFLLHLLQHLDLQCAAPTMQSILSGEAPVSYTDLIDGFSTHEAKNCWFILQDLLGVAISDGKYDARARAVLLRLACELNISWYFFAEYERLVALTLALVAQSEENQEALAQRQAVAAQRARMRWIKVGIASVVGGALIGLTGGLAAPAVAAGAAALVGGSTAITLSSVSGIYAIGTLFGVYGASMTGYRMNHLVGGLKEFRFEQLRPEPHTTVTIGISGWLSTKTSYDEFFDPWLETDNLSELYGLVWESGALYALGHSLEQLLQDQIKGKVMDELIKQTALQGVMSAIAWPSALLKVASFIDNPWSAVMSKAEQCGHELATALLGRAQGHRPTTLVGYSMGAKAIYHCLRELKGKPGAEGIIQNVYIFGAPVTARGEVWRELTSLVSGEIVNGYSSSDWLLRFVCRGWNVESKVAGLDGISALPDDRIRNVDLQALIKGHLDYPLKMPTVLRRIGLRTMRRGAPNARSIGQRVRVDGYGHGILRFCGHIPAPDVPDIAWYGVALDRPLGENDGEVRGVRLFHCRPKHGLFFSCRSRRVWVEEYALETTACYSATCARNGRCFSPTCQRRIAALSLPVEFGGGSGGGGGYQGANMGGVRDGDSEYIRLDQEITTNIFTITGNVNTMQRMVSMLGTQRDTPELRHKLQDVQTQTAKIVRDTTFALRNLGNLDGGSPQEQRKRQIQQEKLSNDFKSALEKFQTASQLAVSKEKNTLKEERIRAGSFRRTNYDDDQYDDNQRLLHSQPQAGDELLDEQVDFNDAMIQEREEGIRELEATMQEVNEIYRDLATLVHEQGSMIDNIEANMTSTQSYTESGRENVQKASHYQKKARNKMCILLIVVTVIAAILTIVLVTKLK